jgi:hypothetical protein
LIILATLFQTAVALGSNLDSSSGQQSSSIFDVTPSNITIPPTYGFPGSNLTIAGAGFLPNTNTVVWFDTNGTNARDPGEPSRSFNTTNNGSFPAGISLTIPSVPPGNYKVLIDSPAGGNIEAWIPYMVMDLTTTPPNPVFSSSWLLIIIIVLVVLVAASGGLLVKVWLDSKSIEKTNEKLKNGEIAIKVRNITSKIQIKSDTLFKADSAISVRIKQDSGKQSIKKKGKSLLAGKEDR